MRRLHVKRPASVSLPPGNTEQFRNIHENKKCFVCGAGPTLNSLDLSGIFSYPVISVNSSAILMPWMESGDALSRFWISTDSLCIQWDYFWNKVMKFECTRIVRNSWAKHANDFKKPMNYYTPRPGNNPNWKEPGLMAGSSILSAVDLALLMGCKSVFLLGVDHRMVSGHSHFWQNWPIKDRPHKEGQPASYFPCQRQQSRVFTSNLKSFDILQKYSEKIGAKIYNCSSISEVKSFDYISLEDALKS